MQVRIIRKFAVATDICVFELVSPDGSVLPPFTAGAHIDVDLGNGMTRQYSLCNSPADRSLYRIGVLREVNSRGGSIAMHALTEGDLLEISRPKNHFPLAEAATHIVLFAGGIGVTPIMSMAEHLVRVGVSFELHYCVRDPSRAAFLSQLTEGPFADRVRLYFDNAGEQHRADFKALLRMPELGKHLYVCGPAGFIDGVSDAARSAGWDGRNVHREYFAASQPPLGTQGIFQIRLAGNGRVVDVGENETVIEALAKAGVEVLTSCEQGVCGTCLTRVLSGEPDHRDLYLTDDERSANDRFLPCCSRSKSPMLVLDL
ncbi:vanillate O-demethylase ferredoxin subunit [Paraburkholderia sp. BL6665CI2N2]|uniref:PDR/VanB family oxidoreductase n=1 Tax=Paraburkholderia sp. BL6665CI2N2 TaxID=1938806 RepID=UPI0010669067|nr:PDR/VanB family oxidoreductase [Paraburkholderia sp. BL6665CI2N2]TDY15823.1 vanillate O-demethylase ferredoxin subunit [Paraburkholderia sp. BL6665CI2N2]